MTVEQTVDVELGTGRNHWVAAIVTGLIATIVFGVLAMVMMPDMMGMIGAMFGFEGNVAVGWAAHLFHGTVFGLMYAAIVSLDQLRAYASRVAYGAGLGLVYGILIWVVSASIVMPVWLGMAEMAPVFDPMSLVGHIVYAVILGAGIPACGRKTRVVAIDSSPNTGGTQKPTAFPASEWSVLQ